MSREAAREITTLEPLMDAVIEGVRSAGWELSGLQKTTSEEFRGRWAGDSTRSAYLFFHREGIPEGVSIDGFLDETSRGLGGNLALVVDGPLLGEADPAPELLRMARAGASTSLPEGYETPVSLRMVLPVGREDPEEAELELRFKLQIPRSALHAGASAVAALASTAVGAFEVLLERVAAGGFGPVE